MKQVYLTPSSQIRDLSKFHFAQNQATCVPGIFTLEQDLSSLSGFCGLGQVGGDVQLCLNDAVDPEILQGFIFDMAFGPSLTVVSCTSSSSPGCPATYVCDVSPDAGQADCVNSIFCSDGTFIDTCATTNCG